MEYILHIDYEIQYEIAVLESTKENCSLRIDDTELRAPLAIII